MLFIMNPNVLRMFKLRHKQRFKRVIVIFLQTRENNYYEKDYKPLD